MKGIELVLMLTQLQFIGDDRGNDRHWACLVAASAGALAVTGDGGIPAGPDAGPPWSPAAASVGSARSIGGRKGRSRSRCLLASAPGSGERGCEPGGRQVPEQQMGLPRI